MTSTPPPPVQFTSLNPVVRITDAIAALDMECAAPDALLKTMNDLDLLKREVRELGHLMEAAAIDWIKAHGDITVGEMRYYVGTTTHSKSTDHKATVDAILRAAGGDLDQLAECISSDGLKSGACKKLLGETVFHTKFSTVVMSDLKTGKPLRKLKKSNDNF